MSTELIGLISLIVLLALIYSGMRVGYVMLFVGFFGLCIINGFDGAMAVLSLIPFRTIASYTFAAVGGFMLAGIIISDAGFGKDMFDSAYHWLGNTRGGLSMATSTASAVLGFITYSTIANITMGKIAIPEMKKYGYEDGMSAASVCGGASLASIVPPSTGFILYSMLTSVSLGKLYMGAIFPAAILFVLILIGIFIKVTLHPDCAPSSGHKFTFWEKLKSLRLIWPILVVILLSLVGIYTGIITPTEASAVSAMTCIVLALLTRRMRFKELVKVVKDQAQMLGMVATLLTGAYVFQRLITLSRLPMALSSFIMGLDASPYVIMFVIIVAYVLFGMFSDINAAILITIPIIYPIVQSLGFDLVWFGVVVVSLIELGAISPPLGLNVFTLSGISGIPSPKIFKAAVPYMICIVALIGILVVFPQLATWLPSTM